MGQRCDPSPRRETEDLVGLPAEGFADAHGRDQIVANYVVVTERTAGERLQPAVNAARSNDGAGDLALEESDAAVPPIEVAPVSLVPVPPPPLQADATSATTTDSLTQRRFMSESDTKPIANTASGPGLYMERTTGFEPATLTLARRRIWPAKTTPLR